MGRTVRNVLINLNRDVHPCTYSLFDPSDLQCQICGKKRQSLTDQGHHTGHTHFDGTFENDMPFGHEFVQSVTLPEPFEGIPFIVTAFDQLNDGFGRYTVTATLLTGFPQ